MQYGKYFMSSHTRQLILQAFRLMVTPEKREKYLPIL